MSSTTAPRAASLERYARRGIDAASLGVSIGFGAATTGTRIGFGIARGITTTAVSIGSALFDYALGTDVSAGSVLNHAIIQGLKFAESIVLTPMQLGESIASSSLVAASSTLDALAKLLGSEEPSFTLGAFVQLVRREWNEPVLSEHLPEDKFSLWETTRALVAWASLQAVTTDFAQRRLLQSLVQIPAVEWYSSMTSSDVDHTNEEIHVTSNITLQGNSGELTTAEIGRPNDLPPNEKTSSDTIPTYSRYATLRANLKRCSKLCLGSYGGAGMIFFGIPMPTPAGMPTTDNTAHTSDPAQGCGPLSDESEVEVLAGVVHEAELEAALPHADPPRPKFWDMVWGKHDREIFEGFAVSSAECADSAGAPVATVGNDENLPRFWILTDHGRKEVVLVLRGTMSFRELAIDLTCEAIDFVPGTASTNESESHMGQTRATNESSHRVHSGIWKIAQEMGGAGRPVTHAVSGALRKNKGYLLCGHSLGAGIAAMLALMWADPTTCETIRSSGLPGGRKVSAYCFAPPCVTSPELSRLCSSLVVSFVFSQDLVARLSLGSVRDLVRAAWWICYGNRNPTESGANIMARIASFQDGRGMTDEERELTQTQFIALRKTLEANMHMADLFPTGRVLLALRPEDLPVARSRRSEQEGEPGERIRLYEVQQVEVAFGQIVFARDMLSCHLPHRYDQLLHEYL